MKKIIAVIVMCAAVAVSAFTLLGNNGVVGQNVPIASPVKEAPVASWPMYTTEACATKAAYNRLRKGQSKRHAAWLFRSKGHRKGTATTFIEGRKVTADLQTYKTCKISGSVTVMYLNGKVIRKTSVFHG